MVLSFMTASANEVYCSGDGFDFFKKIIALERQMQKEAGRFVEELKNRGYRDGDVLSATFQQNGARWCAKFQGFDYIVDFGEMKLT